MDGPIWIWMDVDLKPFLYGYGWMWIETIFLPWIRMDMDNTLLIHVNLYLPLAKTRNHKAPDMDRTTETGGGGVAALKIGEIHIAIVLWSWWEKKWVKTPLVFYPAFERSIIKITITEFVTSVLWRLRKTLYVSLRNWRIGRITYLKNK